MFDAVERVLLNGIRLITIKKDTRIAALHLGIKVGSIYEKENEKGIAHFIEHMLFKGTVSRNNQSLNEELENLGGEYNAYTDYTSTVYSITGLREKLEKSLELISDMIINPEFNKIEIEKERKVILSEIRSDKDDMEQFSFSSINKIAFKKSPLKYDVCGDEKSIKGFTTEDLVEFHHKYYLPNNCVISVVSSYDHERVFELVSKYFRNWKPAHIAKNKIILEDNIGCRKTSYKRDIEQSSVMFLFTLYGLNERQELAMRVLNHKLGASPNSILFRKLREEKGLAYDVYTDLDLTENVKTLYIYTTVSEESVNDAINIILQSIKDIKDGSTIFDNNSISLMKDALKTSVAFTLEDSSDIGSYVLGRSMEGKSIFKFNQDIKEIEKIKKEEIYEIARKVLNYPTIYILKNHK